MSSEPWRADKPFVAALLKREYLSKKEKPVMSAGVYLYLHELWCDGVEQGKMATLEDWQAVLEYWRGQGRDLKHLEIPPELAVALGVPLTVTVAKREVDMTEQDTETESFSTELKWKKRKEFDGKSCGIQGCNNKPDGYIAGKRATKESKNGRLWYGPACKACVSKAHPSLTPMSLAELAHQRNGASDLALVMDLEVGDVLKRLDSAGIDENGRLLKDALAADAIDETVEPLHPHIESFAIALSIPYDDMLAKKTEAEGTIVALQEFHITNQEQMDYASTYLARVKGLYKEIEAQRKDVSKPFRKQVEEIQKLFTPALERLLEVENLLKLKIQEGLARAQQAQQEAFVQTERALATGNLAQAAEAAQQAVASDVTLSKGVHTTSKLRFEVVSPADVPAWAWSPDPAKIQAAIDAGWTEIPGVRIFAQETVVSRGKPA